MNAQAVKFFLDRHATVKLEREEYTGILHRVVDDTFLELGVAVATPRTASMETKSIRIADIVDILPTKGL
jgi:hypothetical protein